MSPNAAKCASILKNIFEMNRSSSAVDKAKTKEGGTILDETNETQLTQPSQPPVPSSEGKKQVKSPILTPGLRPTPSKRPRLRENGDFSRLQPGTTRFGSSCNKCSEIRSSLKLEIAKLRKLNSETSRLVKNLREEIVNLKRDKQNLQNSVNFLQTLYSKFDIVRKT